MNTICNRDLLQLVEYSNAFCASLYLPIYTGAEGRQNPIRLKKLLRTAEAALQRHGAKASIVQDALASANDMMGRLKCSAEGGEAFAFFLGHGECQSYCIPASCDETCIVGRHFYIIPLISALAENGAFYVLAVSQNQVRLLHGSRVCIEEITVPDLPSNIHEALRLDVREPSLQAHQAHTDMTKHKEGLVFHGHGGEPDAAEVEILSYCRKIEEALWPILRNKSEPMVFAGVDYLFPVYCEVNRYPHLLPTPIIGNPELLSAADLRQAGWEIVEPTLDAHSDAVVSKYGDCIAQGRTSNSIEDILIAASAGAVETLFIDPAVKRTGCFDPDQLTVRIDDQPNDDNEDLVNLAATIVLRNSGMVMPMPSGDIPGGGVMAAIMRYEFPPSTEQMSTATQTQRRRW